MLGLIAEAGSGTYFYIENSTTIAPSFADCLGGLLSVIGQDVTVSLTLPDPSVKLNKVHTHYKTTTTIDKDSNLPVTTIYFSDLQSEEKRDVLCELTVSQVKAETKEYIPILTSTLNYFHLITQKHQSQTVNTQLIRVLPDAGVLSEMKVNKDIDKQRNRILVAEAITKANDLAQKNNLPEARKTLESAIKTILESVTGNEQFCKNLVNDLRTSLSGLRDQNEYAAKGSKAMNAYSNAHSKQRANLQSSSTYETSSRAVMKSKMAQFE